jgi:hypothetical protein
VFNAHNRTWPYPVSALMLEVTVPNKTQTNAKRHRRTMAGKPSTGG